MLFLIMVMTAGCSVNEYHISIKGNDQNEGSASKPYRTISAAAAIAQPGDVVIVHGGTYRERINPPRGGTSDRKRIVYRAAEGEEVIIKGSEVIKGWQKVQKDTWKTTIDNSFFGDFNPYSDLIRGDWFNPKGREHHTGAVYQNGHWLVEAARLEDVLKPIGSAEGIPETTIQQHQLWFAEVDASNTTIWAQFKDANPNESQVEINVRQAIFYPEKPGVNYITVWGFKMMHAATPWAPPTAEQIGLIGTHWSMGWIIENNDISYSVCTGITLGKHGDEFDNTSANTAEGYVETIERALEKGWSKDNIGRHLVRNNHISHCEQAGIVGSMGPIFSTITDNTIHNIHIRRLFTGAEMAGIKFHGAIDTVISNNHIYHTNRGIWLDWMTQGTRVTGNLLHDNGPREDLFVEVNHGPFLVDNNVFLSGGGLLESCGGGAYAHNLFGGQIRLRAELTRETPFHKAHSTQIVGLSKVVGDDERFHNNLFIGHSGLSVYGEEAVNLQAVGNVFLAGAKPSTHDREALVVADFDPGTKLEEKSDGWWLEISVDPTWASGQKRGVVTTESLGRAKLPDEPYEKPDGTPYRLDTDYFGLKRNTRNPAPGPFRSPSENGIRLKVWPKKQPKEKSQNN
jgi:alpha-N-arabinofuranosidase